MEDQKQTQISAQSTTKKLNKLCRCGRQYQGRYDLCSPCLAKDDEDTERAIEQWKFRKKRSW